MPRHFIKFLGGDAEVDDLVGLVPSNHGTENPLADEAGEYFDCPACIQQMAGSEFITALNAGDETPAPVSYTQITTRYDRVVTPYTSAFLSGPASRVTNVTVQDRCPLDLTDHVGIIYDPVALQWVLNAVGRPGPADRAFRVDCSGAGLLTFPDSDSGEVQGPDSASPPRLAPPPASAAHTVTVHRGKAKAKAKKKKRKKKNKRKGRKKRR